MRACINEATTMTTDFETDLRAYSAAGFKAVELWLDKARQYVEKNSVAQARRLLRELGLQPISACAQGGLMLAEGEDRAQVLAEFRRNLALCEALEAPKMIAFAGRTGQPSEVVYERMAANLREAAGIAAEYDVSLAIEFIKGHPILGSLPTALALARRAACPNVGVLFDFFHFYAGLSKVEDLDALAPGDLMFVHVNDAPPLPREMLTDAHRVWLGEGCFPLAAFRRQLERVGYADGVSIELFHRDTWAQDPYEVARKAFRNVTEFIEGRL